MLGLRFALLILGVRKGLLRCNSQHCNKKGLLRCNFQHCHNELVIVAEVAVRYCAE